jgi:hypothetical protein
MAWYLTKHRDNLRLPYVIPVVLVSIVTRLRAGRPGFSSCRTLKELFLYLCHRCLDRLRGPADLLSSGYLHLVPRLKCVELYLQPYMLMTWCLVKYKDIFTCTSHVTEGIINAYRILVEKRIGRPGRKWMTKHLWDSEVFMDVKIRVAVFWVVTPVGTIITASCHIAVSDGCRT